MRGFSFASDPFEALFISGEIGITPVRGIIAKATCKQSPHDITLFYSNRTPEDAPFLSDFEKYIKGNSHLDFVPVMTMTDPGKWDGENGRIFFEKLNKKDSSFLYISVNSTVVTQIHSRYVTFVMLSP